MAHTANPRTTTTGDEVTTMSFGASEQVESSLKTSAPGVALTTPEQADSCQEEPTMDESSALFPYRGLWETVRSEFTCDHSDTQLRVLVASNGARHFHRQCQTCGEKVAHLRKADISRHLIASIPEIDKTIADNWHERQRQRYDELRAEVDNQQARERTQRNAEWWARYAEYLTSRAWREKRAAVLARAGYLCEGCRDNQATQVHHLTYVRVGNELLFDLVAICDTCHDHATKTDRASRQQFWVAS